MEDFNISDHFNEDGSVNADGPGLRTLAGPDHAESQSYIDAKDFPSFVKAAFDTHSLVGKKMENVIQKPTEDASDEDRAAYRASLKAELGAVKSGAEFEFVRPDLPKGMQYDEAMEVQFRDLFAQIGMSKAEAKLAFDGYNNYMVEKHNKAVEAETIQIAADDEQLRTDWPGNDMLLNTRMAFMAMQTLGAEAFPKLWNGWTEPDGTEIKGLEARLKESQIFDSPGDLEKWRECGVDTSQLRFYCVVGKRMQAANILTGDGGSGGAVKNEGKAFVNAVNKGSALSTEGRE